MTRFLNGRDELYVYTLYMTQPGRRNECPLYSVYTAVSRSSDRFSIQGSIARQRLRQSIPDGAERLRRGLA